MFSLVAEPVYIPTNSVGRFLFLYIFTSIYLFFYDSSDRCEVIPPCGFDVHFSDN